MKCKYTGREIVSPLDMIQCDQCGGFGVIEMTTDETDDLGYAVVAPYPCDKCGGGGALGPANQKVETR